MYIIKSCSDVNDPQIGLWILCSPKHNAARILNRKRKITYIIFMVTQVVKDHQDVLESK